MGKLKIWTIEEDHILKESFSLFKSKKWKRTSQKLKENGYNRSDVECRQRYVNHLDPSVNKELWAYEQLQILYDNYDQHKNKWFIIQKALPGRTQTKIKNYFYGNIRYLLKIIIKNFLKQSTGFINDVKTNILLDMYQGKNDFEGFNIIKKAIEFMDYKVQKKQCIKLIKKNQNQFQKLAKIFLEKYNLRLTIPEGDSSQNYSKQIKAKKQIVQNFKCQGVEKAQQNIKIQQLENVQIKRTKSQQKDITTFENILIGNKIYNRQFQQINWPYQYPNYIHQYENNVVFNSIPSFQGNFFNCSLYYPYQ